MFDSPSANPNTTAWLVYNNCVPNPQPQILQEFYDFDDTDIVPATPLPVVMYDDLVSIVVNFTQYNGVNLAIINNNTYEAANVPAIFTALTTGSDATNPESYGTTDINNAPFGTGPNTFVLNHLDMIWLAINNDDTGGHPCISQSVRVDIVHLHGHIFQVLYRSDEGVGHFDPTNLPTFPANPVRRDVILVNAGGYAVIAFRADNPGAWFLYPPSLSNSTNIDIVISIGMFSRGW
jgi:iron transport multicopper oxidase